MTVTRLAAVAARGRGQVDDGLAGVGPCPVQPPPLGPAPGGRGGRPLLNVAGGGGRGLAAHAGGVHRLGGDEV